MEKKTQARKKAPNFIHVSPVVVLNRIKLRRSDGMEEEVCLPEVTDTEDNRTQILQDEQKLCENEFIHAMTNDEVDAHIQKCLEMSSQNKITQKNAFALQLIDCMNMMKKKEDFSTMACTLDAGTKIYSYRVDCLHQQVMKLANEVVQYQRKKKESENENGKPAEVDSETRKQRKRENKKSIMGTSEILNRKWKGKDPREGYIKVDGPAGAIISNVRRDPDTLAFSLENNLPFWKNWKQWKPLTAEGTVTLPRITIVRDSARCSQRSVKDPLEGPVKNTDQYMAEDERKQVAEHQTQDSPMEVADFEDAVSETQVDFEDNFSGDHESNNEKNTDEVEVISTAIKRLNQESDANGKIQDGPTRFEAMKLVFDKNSEYHYLNMKNAYYWAGPEFWKRPPGKDRPKPKLARKQREPSDIEYNSTTTVQWSKLFKRQFKLTKKTVVSWKNKKPTLPINLKIENATFLDLFHISRYCDQNGDTQDSIVSEDISVNLEGNEVNSVRESDSDEAGESSSIKDSLNDNFYECAPGSSASPDVDPLNCAFYDAGLTQRTDGAHQGRVLKVEISSSSSQNYDETSLVQPPKRVTFQPIKCSAKPVLVDMHNLKQNMMGIIDEEVGQDDGNTEVRFSRILKKLPNQLDKRTAEDLSPAMAFLALLTLANEHDLQLRNNEDKSEVFVSHETSES